MQSDRPFNITLHTLRHTFGSWLAIVGVPLRAIQKLIGRRSITTTERYAHLSGENLATAVDRIERLLPNSLPSSAEEPQNRPVQALVSTRKVWCGGPESNRHVPCGTRDFKSLASTSSATPAYSCYLVTYTISAHDRKSLNPDNVTIHVTMGGAFLHPSCRLSEASLVYNVVPIQHSTSFPSYEFPKRSKTHSSPTIRTGVSFRRIGRTFREGRCFVRPSMPSRRPLSGGLNASFSWISFIHRFA